MNVELTTEERTKAVELISTQVIKALQADHINKNNRDCVSVVSLEIEEYAIIGRYMGFEVSEVPGGELAITSTDSTTESAIELMGILMAYDERCSYSDTEYDAQFYITIDDE